MLMTVRQIILWPKNREKRERRLRFRPSRINVITGWSRTGKSSIGAIVDYCLGSTKCTIPAGRPIRDSVEWFSVVVTINDASMRISRANPGAGPASPLYEVIHGRAALTRKVPTSNSTLDAFKAHMNAIAGLSDVGVVSQTDDVKGASRASFRDMAAFNFLPQHIVANPYALFFKTDTTEHREKLRAIFPLVLGAIDNSYLVARQRLAELEREGKQLAATVESRKKIIESWRSDAFTLHQRAQELGLLSTSSQPESLEACLRELEAIPSSASERLRASDVGGAADTVLALQRLESEEARLDSDVSDLKRKLRGIRRLRSSLEGYSDTVRRHEGRVQGFSWFSDKVAEAAECPICGSETDNAKQELARFQAAMDELQRLASTTSAAPPMLDQEMLDLERTLRSAEQKLFETRIQRLELEPQPDDEEAPSATLEEAYRFIGRLEQSLRNIRLSEGEDGIEKRLKELRADYLATKRGLDEKGKKEREVAAHRALSGLISKYAKFLVAERSDDAPEIDSRELTLRFSDVRSGRRDFLWEIGSGANWMAYHIATMLAVHEFLLERQSKSPVPTFLIIDQPSQVFFPSGTFDDLGKRGLPADYDEDLKNTRRIFETLSEGIKNSKGKLQIILTEHANVETWLGIQSVHLVANWHSADVDYLIPRDWIEHTP